MVHKYRGRVPLRLTRQLLQKPVPTYSVAIIIILEIHDCVTERKVNPYYLVHCCSSNCFLFERVNASKKERKNIYLLLKQF